MTPKIALYLSPEADAETRQRFFVAVDQLSEVLKAGMTEKNRDEERRIKIGEVENQDDLSGVVWISVHGTERISTCKMLAKLFMERHRVGDKCEIVVNPKPALK